MKHIVISGLIAISLALCSLFIGAKYYYYSPLYQPITKAVAVIHPTKNNTASGVVTFEQKGSELHVTATIAGLTPGKHGFHIHETGNCSPDFGAAGGHFNPEGHGHGVLHEGGYHAGDLPNIHANADGVAQADFFTPDVTLREGAENSLFDADGSAIVIHEDPDSYGEDAAAGARVACGVIAFD